MQSFSQYLPTLISTLICFSLGTFWFSRALFGNKWMELIGKTDDEMKNILTLKMYGIFFLVLFIFNYAMSVFIDITNTIGMAQGIETGIWIWAGFCATTIAFVFLFEGRSRILYVITTGYLLVACIISGTLHAMWR